MAALESAKNDDALAGCAAAAFCRPSVHTDLTNAGANWVDREVVEDGNLITSRKPEDIPAFSNKIIEALAKAS